MKKIITPLKSYRKGPSNRTDLTTLIQEECVQNLIHPGEPKPYRIVFVRVVSKMELIVRDNILKKLPDHSSLRVVPDVLHINIIISGPLSKTWIDSLIPDNIGQIESVLYGELEPLGRYRWREPVGHLPKKEPFTPQKAHKKADTSEISPNPSNLAGILKEQEIKIVFNYKNLPVISCCVIIGLNEVGAEDFWYTMNKSHKEYLYPIRDVYHSKEGIKGNLAGDSILKPSVVKGEIFIFCEFDIVIEEEKSVRNSFHARDPLSAAIQWRNEMIRLPFIGKISLIPCTVFSEGHDYFNRYKAFNEELATARNLVEFPVCSETNMFNPDEDIQIPINTICFCGQRRQGKSFAAYTLATSINKSNANFDVIYIQCKGMSGRPKFEDNSKTSRDFLEFSKLVNNTNNSNLNFIDPEEIFNKISSSKEKGLYYAEANQNISIEHIIKLIFEAQAETKRGLLILFDELLGDISKLEENIAPLIHVVREGAGLDIYVGVIAQQLSQFFSNSECAELLKSGSLIHVGPLPDDYNEINYFDSLIKVRKENPFLEDRVDKDKVTSKDYAGFSIFLLNGLPQKGVGDITPYPFKAANLQYKLDK